MLVPLYKIKKERKKKMSLESNLLKMSELATDLFQLQEILLCDYNMMNTVDIKDLTTELETVKRQCNFREEELEKIKMEYKKLSENEFFKNGCDGSLEKARRKLRIQIEKDCEEKYREQIEQYQIELKEMKDNYYKIMEKNKEKDGKVFVKNQEIKRLNKELERLGFLEAKLYEQEQIINIKEKTINDLHTEIERIAKSYSIVEADKRNISNIIFKNMGAISYLSAAKALDEFNEQSFRVKNQLIQDALNILQVEEKKNV